jgi:GNAT superfamily N-acetyltransferase
MTCTVRAAAPADVPALFALFNDAYQAESGDAAPCFKSTPRFLAPDELLPRLAGGGVLAAEAGGALVGALAFDLVRDARGVLRAHFGPFATARAARGGGVGSALLAALRARAAAAGAASLDAEVVHLRVDILPMYFALGFRVVGAADFPAPERCTRDAHFVLIRRAVDE